MQPSQTTPVGEVVEGYQEGALQGAEGVHEVALLQVQDLQVREGGTCKWLGVDNSHTCMTVEHFLEGVGGRLGSREDMVGRDGAAAWEGLGSCNNFPWDHQCHHVPCHQM
jgi:hypothetical protein